MNDEEPRHQRPRRRTRDKKPTRQDISTPLWVIVGILLLVCGSCLFGCSLFSYSYQQAVSRQREQGLW